jgi:hypothetical protein
MPIHPHDYLIPIDEKEILWRYINTEKLFSLLSKKRLFFCRADKFSDPFECSTPVREYEWRKGIWESRLGNNYERIEEQMAKMGDFYQRVKKSTVVNCWHINSHESDAMWRIYLKTNEGVAIQSNISRITEALQDCTENIYASKVRYIDYSSGIYHHPIEYPVETLNTITPVIHKRFEFSHECEFRLFQEIRESTIDLSGEYWTKQENSRGKFINVDINKLIERIVFSPSADIDYKNFIRLKIEEMGYKFSFYDSKLSNSPIY